jgi:hypothetical protein
MLLSIGGSINSRQLRQGAPIPIYRKGGTHVSRTLGHMLFFLLNIPQRAKSPSLTLARKENKGRKNPEILGTTQMKKKVSHMPSIHPSHKGHFTS